MSLFITSLNSGSNGNCYYIGNQNEAVLVDAGISCLETERRMKQLKLSLLSVKAIFVTHEHSDHIKGIETLSKKYHLPVYITPTTLSNTNLKIGSHLVRSFKAYEAIQYGSLCITPFPKLHDAGDPHSFTVECHGVKVGIFTDIGTPCSHVVHHFRQCHAAFLEANYDETMLKEGNYPLYLKKRINGGMGHLSNSQAFELFRNHRSAFMTHLILSHLSENNNSPRLVKNLFDTGVEGVTIIVASRSKETPLFCIQNVINQPLPGNKFLAGGKQLTLFFE